MLRKPNIEKNPKAVKLIAQCTSALTRACPFKPEPSECLEAQKGPSEPQATCADPQNAVERRERRSTNSGWAVMLRDILSKISLLDLGPKSGVLKLTTLAMLAQVAAPFLECAPPRISSVRLQ